MEGDRLQTVSNPLTPSTASAWFDFDQSFQIPNPASTDPLEPTVFDLDFFNPPSLSSYAVSPLPGEFILSSVSYTVLMYYKCPPLTLLFRRATCLPCLKYLNLIFHNWGFQPLTLTGPDFRISSQISHSSHIPPPSHRHWPVHRHSLTMPSLPLHIPLSLVVLPAQIPLATYPLT